MTIETVLDPLQLNRIESVHRGFLYQHLYVTACLLISQKANVQKVLTERDEDLELMLEGRRLYVQIKTRATPLVRSDISQSLDNFIKLRNAHESKERSGKPEFWIISNAKPGKELLEEIESNEWPNDVTIRWPGNKDKDEIALPPACLSVTELIKWCVEQAKSISFLSVEPETLVFKLAGYVSLASTGTFPYQDHSFIMSEISNLFEQVVVQLQDFPTSIGKYRPLMNEPKFISKHRVRIISGFSGSGKTTWASQAALYNVGPSAIYFDVSHIPGASIATALSRELIARLMGSGTAGLGQKFLPGTSGLEVLSAANRKMRDDGTNVVVVIDNAHEIPVLEMKRLLDKLFHPQVILLCQPAQTTQSFHTILNLPIEYLDGWSVDTIALEARDNNCAVDYSTSLQVRILTSGQPLYVQSLIRLANSHYSGNVASLCNDLEKQVHQENTAQELILGEYFDSLPEHYKNVLAILGLVDCPLSSSEIILLLNPLEMSSSLFAKLFRDLSSFAIIQRLGDGSFKLHEAIRILCRQRANEIDHGLVKKAQEALKGILLNSLLQKKDILRLSLYIRILGETGDIKTVVDLAGEELLHEMGLRKDFQETLSIAANSKDLPGEQQFWALDALLFDEIRTGNNELINNRIKAMKELIQTYKLGQQEQLAYNMKRMLAFSIHGKIEKAEEVIEELKESIPKDSSHLRVLKYNIAISYRFRGEHAHALRLSEELIDEYYEVLGLSSELVYAKNPVDIWPLIKVSESTTDDIKHLADCLDLYAYSKNNLKQPFLLERLHAMKFYSMVGAIDSALRVGQDAVDDYVGRGDYLGARSLLETSLLPTAIKLGMTEKIIPIRSQYAVVLAYCGDFDSAEQEMETLSAFMPGLSEIGRVEINDQLDLILQLKHLASSAMISNFCRVKVGRNERCPCGSGKKYKKCCLK